MNQVKIIVSKEFLRLKVILALIYVILELYYHYFISDNFQYLGYFPDLNLGKYVLTKIVFIGLTILSFGIYKRSSFLYSIFLLLIFFFYIPNAILFSFSNGSIGPFISNVFFVSLFSLTPYIKFSIPEITFLQKRKSLILIGLPILVLIPIVITFKTDIYLKTLLLQEVYETREVFSAKMGGYLNYIYNIMVKTLIPAVLVFFMIKRKRLFVALLLLALLYLYVISGNKIVYFTTIILVFFYYLGSSFTSKTSNFFIIVLGLLFIAPFIDSFLLDTPVLSGTFVNRFLFIPSLLTQWYFDFFDGNPFYFAESNFFNQFFSSPYDMPVGFLMTKIHWYEPTVYANNGVVSDGFMNLGYIGVLIFSIIFSLLFSLFNSLNLDKGYFGIFFTYVYLILSVQFLSAFITGGIFVFLLLTLFLLHEKKPKLDIKS